MAESGAASRPPAFDREALLRLAPEAAWRRLRESQVVVLSGGRSSEREVTGDFGTLLYAGVDWKDPVLARHSMTLMAEKVAPRVVR